MDEDEQDAIRDDAERTVQAILDAKDPTKGSALREAFEERTGHVLGISPEGTMWALKP